MKIINLLFYLIYRYIIRWNVADYTSRQTNEIRVRKAIILGEPHTSYLDALLFWMHIPVRDKYFSTNWNQNSYVVLKEEVMQKPVMRNLLKPLNVLTVNREAANLSLIKQIKRMSDAADQFYLIICPKGTRKPVKDWNRGFYELARLCKLPIFITGLDYGTKEIWYKEVYNPTGNYEEDISYIRQFYKPTMARFPARF
jgi:1-acyl-sn-glycerol-3-phosphate acyltransferase